MPPCWRIVTIVNGRPSDLVRLEQVVGRGSYYVQKMAVENRPTYNVAMNKVLRATDTVRMYPAISALVRGLLLWNLRTSSGYQRGIG